jgi:alkanesulfonate monooxygenase SsuD/methylene tetrahydromethanopterin reductase-like flavin-dependent oxidoreductase (luciferase family)
MEEADRLGLDAIKVAEHHGFEDGYIPQPLTVLSAAAARTKAIGLATGILIAPLHHAVEIAEQAAVVDGISGGRLELAFGTGYHRLEYELYGVNINRRFRLLEQRVLDVRDLWATARATPTPERGEVPIWLGVGGRRGAEIAGRLGTGLLTLVPDPWDAYKAALVGAGHPSSVARAGGALQVVLSEDPERDLRVLAPRIKHNADTYLRAVYAGTGASAPELDDASQIVNKGEVWSAPWSAFGVLTPAEAVDRIRRLGDERSLADVDIVYIQASVSGVIDDIARRNVELVATELKPRLTELLDHGQNGERADGSVASLLGGRPAS